MEFIFEKKASALCRSDGKMYCSDRSITEFVS